MVKVDYHVHSTWSPDSGMKVRKALECCREKGISEIVFTDHLDLDVEDKGAVPLDLAAYRTDLASARWDYPDISIGIGLEVGVHPKNLLATENYIHPYSWDFIVLSVHQFEHIGFCSPILTKLYDIPFILKKYWETWFYNVRIMKTYDVLGHMDYLLRYQPISEEDFVAWDDQKDAMLELLVKRRKGIEINAKGLHRLGRPHPPMYILKRYKELGGEIVTLGSDGHALSSLGRNFETMVAYLSACGFDYFARKNFETGEFYFEKLNLDALKAE